MAILVDQKTAVVIQGITGTEGARACREMLRFGTVVSAGVTPGKGGQVVEGVPVYDTVAEALAQHPSINTSLIVVPAPAVKDAALEAMAHRIPLINILTEYVPAADSCVMVAQAKLAGSRIIGASSIGIFSPGKAKIGSIGGGEIQMAFSPGPVGVISKSGGMTAEISLALTRAGIGQSTVVGIGGDMIAGTTYAELLPLYLCPADRARQPQRPRDTTAHALALRFVPARRYVPLPQSWTYRLGRGLGCVHSR